MRKASPDASVLDSVFMDVYNHPGHLFRRAQQICVSVFYETVGEQVTPIQYSILRILREQPGVDQKTLAGLLALDTSTTATTAERLEAKGLIRRELHIVDRRTRKLFVTDAGVDMLISVVDGVRRMQTELFADFTAAERRDLMGLLKRFVTLNNARSRAPLDDSGTVAEPPKHLHVAEPKAIKVAKPTKVSKVAKPGKVSKANTLPAASAVKNSATQPASASRRK